MTLLPGRRTSCWSSYRSRARARLRRSGHASPAGGVDGESAAICRGVRAIPRSRFLRRVGEAKPASLEAVEQALAMIIGLRR
jgi:mRNA interferase MazF